MVYPSQAAWCRYLWGGPLCSPQGSEVCIQTPCLGIEVHGEVYLEQKTAHRNSRLLGQPALHWDAQLFADKLHPGSLPCSFGVSLMDNVSLSHICQESVWSKVPNKCWMMQWCPLHSCLSQRQPGSQAGGAVNLLWRTESLWMCVSVLGVLGDWLPSVVPKDLERVYLFFT